MLLEEPEDVLVLRADGRFETSLDLSEHPEEVVTSVEARRPGMMVTEARTIAAFYDPADVLHWVTDALAERYPAVDFGRLRMTDASLAAATVESLFADAGALLDGHFLLKSGKGTRGATWRSSSSSSIRATGTS